MPLLGGLLVTLFGGFATYLGTWLSYKAAVIAASLTAFVALNVALMLALGVAMGTVNLAFPSGVLTTGIWVMLPDNALICLSAIIATDTAVALYRWNAGAVQLAATAG